MRGPDTAARPYGVVALLGAFAFVSSQLVLHALRADVEDWTSHYVSDFANGRLGWVFVLGTALHGIGNLTLGVGLRAPLRGHRLRRWAVSLFGLAAAGVLAAAFLPADAPAGAATAVGLAHRAVVAGSFVLELAALFMFSAAFAASPGWRPLSRTSLALAILAAVALAGFALAVLANRVPGLAERVALASFLAWEVWAGFALLNSKLSSSI